MCTMTKAKEKWRLKAYKKEVEVTKFKIAFQNLTIIFCFIGTDFFSEGKEGLPFFETMAHGTMAEGRITRTKHLESSWLMVQGFDDINKTRVIHGDLHSGNVMSPFKGKKDNKGIIDRVGSRSYIHAKKIINLEQN